MIYAPLVSEILRPTAISDLVLPTGLKRKLSQMVARGGIMNICFYGKPGTGKTSAARILINELQADVYELNGSSLERSKYAVQDIERYCSVMSLFGRPKICFIDEADFMHPNVQAGLRYVIERFSAHVRFILTANDVTKLSDALLSRCTALCFDLPRSQILHEAEQKLHWYVAKLQESGYTIPPDRLNQIVHLHFPDMRKIANNIELEAVSPEHPAA